MSEQRDQKMESVRALQTIFVDTCTIDYSVSSVPKTGVARRNLTDKIDGVRKELGDVTDGILHHLQEVQDGGVPCDNDTVEAYRTRLNDVRDEVESIERIRKSEAPKRKKIAVVAFLAAALSLSAVTFGDRDEKPDVNSSVPLPAAAIG